MWHETQMINPTLLKPSWACFCWTSILLNIYHVPGCVQAAGDGVVRNHKGILGILCSPSVQRTGEDPKTLLRGLLRYLRLCPGNTCHWQSTYSPHLLSDFLFSIFAHSTRTNKCATEQKECRLKYLLGKRVCVWSGKLQMLGTWEDLLKTCTKIHRTLSKSKRKMTCRSRDDPSNSLLSLWVINLLQSVSSRHPKNSDWAHGGACAQILEESQIIEH